MSSSRHQLTDLSGTFELKNGVRMPYLGLGVFQCDNVVEAVTLALETGYRLVDTASIYENEAEVGEAVRASRVPREEIFVTSKIWNTDQGYNSTLDAFEASLKRTRLDYLDLCLIHWPVEGKYKETWRALETLYREKRVRAIGVSNFLKHHLEDLMADATVIPMVNQVEFHPYLVQQELVDFCFSNVIQYQACSPMMRGNVFKLDAMNALAEKYSKTIAQIVLRWDLQKGVATIPKSSKKERIITNADIFDFELHPDDVAFIDSMDCGKRFGPDPDNFDF
ncbi:aldo/keto reductase [Gimesia aquarii]|uniref:Glyoxal reductase n=1 Tax=Gimesia aquarii TaxID=2527964 RepID=A0A517WQ49_9PLAN|nr:aldo/keto reductase [Gimesia aquarii]QDU07356.1 Glyoxal reductase [Gimesia aquarii]